MIKVYTGATVAGSRHYYPDLVTVNLAVEWPLVQNRLIFLWELVSYYDAGRLLGPRANQAPQALVSTLPGLEFMASQDWAFVAGVLIDLFGKEHWIELNAVRIKWEKKIMEWIPFICF